MDNKLLQAKLKTAAENLQDVQIPATAGNLELMLSVLYTMQEVHDELGKEDKPDDSIHE